MATDRSGEPSPGRFSDREDAGRRLASALGRYSGRTDLLVLALPRGGLPVGLEVARALAAPLDVLVVRKLGTPGQPELAMGAIASGGLRVLNQEVIRVAGISADAIDAVEARERQEIERRERVYRGERPRPDVDGKVVLLVDDGIATGSTMRAAIRALRKAKPARIVVAVPVAPPAVCRDLHKEADEVVCVQSPRSFGAISQWYDSFPQVADDDVRRILEKARVPVEPAAT